MSTNTASLPYIFPDDKLTVKEEDHIYNEGTDRYTLDKAPIDEIVTVSNDTSREFDKSVDYQLSNDNTSIEWLDSSNNRPTDGSKFYVTYRCDSIISRFIDSSADEFDAVEDDIVEITEEKFIDNTSDENLDELGKLFGDVIGERDGRTSEEYRIYLKSVIQSFVSTGTKNGIKFAVSAATDIPIEFISIKEDFINNAYEIVIEEETELYIPLDILYQVAEIADPSGVEYATTRYKFTEDAATTTDAITGLGIQIDTSGTVTDTNWDSSNWDTMRWDPQLGTSAMSVSDQTTQDIVVGNASPDSWDVDSWDSMVWDDIDGFEAAQIDDTIGIDVGKSASDTSDSNDTVLVEANDAIYDQSDWDAMVWT